MQRTIQGLPMCMRQGIENLRAFLLFAGGSMFHEGGVHWNAPKAAGGTFKLRGALGRRREAGHSAGIAGPIAAAAGMRSGCLGRGENP